MKLPAIALAAFLSLLCLGCSSVNLGLNPTPTPEALRVTLGGKPPDTWESLRQELGDLEAEGRDLNSRLEAAGHYRALYLEDRKKWHAILSEASYSDRLKAPQTKKNFAKTWPWPIQTQAARLDKEFERVEAKLLLMDSPTPTVTSTPDPDWTATPTVTPTATWSPPIVWPTPRPTRTPTPWPTRAPLRIPTFPSERDWSTPVTFPTPTPWPSKLLCQSWVESHRQPASSPLWLTPTATPMPTLTPKEYASFVWRSEDPGMALCRHYYLDEWE